MSTCIVSPRAARDLEDLHDSIAAHSPRAAARLIDRIERRFQLLETFPEMGAVCEELAPSLRHFPVKGFVIFYRISESAVEIVRVLRGSRDLPSILAQEE